MKSTRVVITRRFSVVIPAEVRTRIGVKGGDVLEINVVRGTLTLTPTVKAGISKSKNDVKNGRSYGPFTNHKEFLASLHKEAGKIRKRARRRAA